MRKTPDHMPAIQGIAIAFHRPKWVELGAGII
jgi:hypothetical protein